MNLLECVEEDDYLGKEVSCSKTRINCAECTICNDLHIWGSVGSLIPLGV